MAIYSPITEQVSYLEGFLRATSFFDNLDKKYTCFYLKNITEKSLKHELNKHHQSEFNTSKTKHESVDHLENLLKKYISIPENIKNSIILELIDQILSTTNSISIDLFFEITSKDNTITFLCIPDTRQGFLILQFY